MEEQKNNRPLVSICATFFNSERYIHRLIESCLNQTYQNIELVLVDDVSTDGSENIIQKYATRDPRVKYYKNDVRVGLAESEMKMFERAKGEYSMMIGADDWLACDYIEHGVRSFLAHPEAAGIIPQVLWLGESNDSTFTVIDRRFYAFFPPKLRSATWFMKRLYRPKQLYVSALALVRSEDYVRAMAYYLANYYHNLPKSASRELKHFTKMAFGMDGVVFAEMLTKHKSIVFDSSLRHIKITLPEGQANNLDFSRRSFGELCKEAWYQLWMFTTIYKEKWPQFYRGMRIWKGAEFFSTVFLLFFRSGLRLSSLSAREEKTFLRDFLSNFSFFEIIAIFIYAVLMIPLRLIGFICRVFVKKESDKIAERVFTKENFLDSEKHFSTS